MAISYSKINIVRSSNKKGARFGIVLKYLPKSFRQFLIKHKHIYRWAESDQFVECALKIETFGERFCGIKVILGLGKQCSC